MGVLVPRRGAWRRRVHRAAHFQRARRAQRPAFCALVQRRALRLASLAVDPGSSGGGRSLSRPRATRAGVYAHRCGTRAARAAWFGFCRFFGGLHVYGRHATELGRILSCRGFLPALSKTRRHGATLRFCVAIGDGAARNYFGVRVGTTRFDRLGVGMGADHWCGNRRRIPAAVVLVADQCVE